MTINIIQGGRTLAEASLWDRPIELLESLASARAGRRDRCDQGPTQSGESGTADNDRLGTGSGQKARCNPVSVERECLEGYDFPVLNVQPD